MAKLWLSVCLTKLNKIIQFLGEKKKGLVISDLVQRELNEMKCDKFYDRIL